MLTHIVIHLKRDQAALPAAVHTIPSAARLGSAVFFGALVLGPILEVAFTFGCHFDLRAPPTAFPVGPLAANDLRTLLFTTLVFAIELGVTVGVIVIDLLTRATTLSSRPVAADSLFAFFFAALAVGTRLEAAP
jgi:hypothetical protein